MKLLTEFIDIKEIDIVKEDIEIDGKKEKEYYLKGPYLEAETKNANGRRYKKDTLLREVQNYKKNIIEKNRSLGELNHPTNPDINLDRVSHKIIELEMRDNIGYGVSKVINTPMGRIAKTLIDEKILLGMSTRGIGTLNGEWVDDEFSLITVDIVHSPSAPSAFVEGILENKEFIIGKDGKIEEVAIEKLKKKMDKKSNKFEHKDISTLTLQYMLEFIENINSK